MRHTARPGETLATIAARHGLDLSEVLRINPAVADPDKLFVGQSVYLPRKSDGGALARWRGQPDGSGDEALFEGG